VRILITGNLGYLGSILGRHLRESRPSADLIGYDSGFFAHCLIQQRPLPELELNVQHFGDVRDFPDKLLDGIDAVIHLAGVSNDPMGNRFEAVTHQINAEAGLRLARLARDAGAKAFVFASSCSIYGISTGGTCKESDPVNPLTAYARSKYAMEQALQEMDLGDMVVSCLRFATACGMSHRLRLDLVLNDFVACALAMSEITVLSDGTPWRPLIDVSDMARAIDWAIGRQPEAGGQLLFINVGDNSWNYQIKELADQVAAAVPGTRVSINTAAPPDERSYRVDFSLYRHLAPGHQPQTDIATSIARLKDGLTAMGFADPDFRSSQLIRLHVLDQLIRQGQLSQSLRWQSRSLRVPT
jgi:nucleoside-diphosphate-sugar epimerase